MFLAQRGILHPSATNPRSCNDFNGDGLRGVDDLLILLASYNGTPQLGPEDMDGNGLVSVEDILTFLTYYDTVCN